jgi:hypothetical protein
MGNGSLFTAKVGRDDAIKLLREWASRRTLIRLDFRGLLSAWAFRARLTEVTGDRLAMLSDDTYAELEFAFAPDGIRLEFGIGTFRNESPDDAAEYDRVLTIFIPVSKDPEHPETLTMIEVKEAN